MSPESKQVPHKLVEKLPDPEVPAAGTVSRVPL